MEIFYFPHFQTSSSLAHIALYTKVTNAATLRKRIINAATAQGPLGDGEREAVNFSFINARLITSRLHLQTAINQAILAQSQNSLRTRTVHSEILWALNSTNNISEAIRRYGISEASTDLIVVRISGPEASTTAIRESISRVVIGVETTLTMLSQLTDWASVRKYHKLDTEPMIFNDTEVANNIVVSTVAMKSVIA
ncbi:CGI-121-domain-containing protein [Collybia nuda]|uniref:EKC/KEOPS complex subunit CGI121 n=1 Tax=Collybia nuda TaxID=64659 RepID=A0A9P6CJR3_9AGAR|nr:CGI-121-domain-containing protein [Collybia nuda]